MDPWKEVGNATFDTKISFEKIQKLREEKFQSEKASTIKKYDIKTPDYETYNYLRIDSDNQEVEDKNTLFNIIQRGNDIKVRRKDRLERYQMKQLEKDKEKLEKEKKRCEEEKRKHSDKLCLIKETFLQKRVKEENRRRFEEKLSHLQEVAINHHNSLLLRQYFCKLRNLVLLARAKETKASTHFSTSLLRKSFNGIQTFSCQIVQKKMDLSQKFSEAKIQHQVFQIMMKIVYESKEKEEKAKSFDKLRIFKVYFQRLKIYRQNCLLTTRTQSEQAKSFFNQRLVSRSFNKWRLWKDQRLQYSKERDVSLRLRSVVKNVLPDFTPPSSTDEDDSGEEELGNKFDERLWKARISTFI